MRITNQMTTNMMTQNISRNMSTVNNLYNQLTTGKKIQMPSDNPILASRALKFRTNISETNQYISNVTQAQSWMDITEQALKNTTESIIDIKELCTEGASGNYGLDNKKTFSDQLSSFLEQMKSEMNVTYAGRYVFSGYRTDKPPVMAKDLPGVVYDINQSFNAINVENSTAYLKATPDSPPNLYSVNKIKLPYTGSSGLNELSLYDKDGNAVTNIPVTTLPTATEQAYNTEPDKAYYIQDTGEIILGKDVLATINANASGRIDVSYRKEGLSKGDLNPEIYFDCVKNPGTADEKTFTGEDQNIQYEFGINTRVPINNNAKDNLTATLYGDLRAMLQLVNSIEYTSKNELIAKYSSPPYSLTGDELTKAVKAQEEEEKQKYDGVLHDAYSNMLGIIDTHASQVSKEYTQLGSRMNRLDLIQKRLVEDRLSYTALMSDNEDVDFLEATMNLNSASYVYQMALKAGGGIMQTSLADFIR